MSDDGNDAPKAGEVSASAGDDSPRAGDASTGVEKGDAAVRGDASGMGDA